MTKVKKLKQASIKYGKFNEPLFFKPPYFLWFVVCLFPLVFTVVGIVNGMLLFSTFFIGFLLCLVYWLYSISPYVSVCENEILVHRIWKMQRIPFSELIKVRFLRNGSKGGGIKFYKKWGNTDDEKKVLELASTINLDKENALKEHLESKAVIVTNLFKWQEEG